jgi:ABC-type nickel/cobalt efflux system permease component RcnA
MAVVMLVVAGPAANAHPLGNFSVNRAASLEISTDGVVLRYAIDMAEIPTLQLRDTIDADGDGKLASSELRHFAEDSADRIDDAVSLDADGEKVQLRRVEARASLAKGSGGLRVLRIAATFTGRLPRAATTIAYADTSSDGRVGWREVVARAVGPQGIVRSDVPETSPSGGLRNYPRDLLSSPLDVTEAQIVVSPGATGGGTPASDPSPGEGILGGFGDRFTSLVEGELSPGFLLAAIALSLGAGALHALGPGHGKTVMAAYLVGAEGRVRHAVVVGIAVSLMHTASVVVLGLVTLWASSLFAPEDVYPWLSFASGVVVLGLGGWLLRARLRKRAHDRAHEHGHDHGHTHSHGHAHHHHHAPGGPSPLSWKGMSAVALSGGLLPSPSALVVLLGAVALHRVALGVTLVGAFSVGLAAALTVVGIVVLKARAFAARRMSARAGAFLPVLSAACLLAVGLFLTAHAATNL